MAQHRHKCLILDNSAPELHNDRGHHVRLQFVWPPGRRSVTEHPWSYPGGESIYLPGWNIPAWSIRGISHFYPQSCKIISRWEWNSLVQGRPLAYTLQSLRWGTAPNFFILILYITQAPRVCHWLWRAGGEQVEQKSRPTATVDKIPFQRLNYHEFWLEK